MSIRISDVRTYVLSAKLSQPFHWSFNRASSSQACLVEIVANDGTSGWGECFGPAALTAAV
ncbi:MAG: mandelate racemase/muconate lactonizing enzyme family protein, partial [Pseudomonadota bacterium]